MLSQESQTFLICLRSQMSPHVINLGFWSYGLAIYLIKETRNKSIFFITNKSLFLFVPWKVACRNTVSWSRDMWGEEGSNCELLRFLYENNWGCGLLSTSKGAAKQLPLRGQVQVKVIKEYLQGHTFSWLCNNTLQYNYWTVCLLISRDYIESIIYNMPQQ